MRKAKKIQLEATHKAFFDMMRLKISVDRLEEFVIPDVMGYGTTIDEKVFDIKGLLNIVKTQEKQSENIQFDMIVTPVHRKIADDENSAVYVDEILVRMQLEEGINEFTARVSTVLDFIDGKWKVIHWHGSKAVDTEGDTWHKEEWKQLNDKLQKQVEEKTDELVQKNRELEIEASLERIRTIAMSMQKAEGLLEVVEILYIELKTLGFTDIRNTIINIFNDTKESFLNYDYSDYGVGGINEVDYNSHPSNIELVNKMREASNEFMITEFTGNELDEWRKWRIDQGQMPDSKLDQAESLYYYEYSIGVGTIGISTFSPINADQLIILNKIRNVFDLAYRRYADIEQAEAHAREAKIEAALERVRSRSMAMHKSEELAETAMIMFEQLCSLGQVPDRLGIVIYNEQQQIFENWITDQSGMQLTKAFKSSIEESTTFAKIYKAWKEKKDSIVIDLSGEELKSWLQFIKGNMKMFINESNIKNRRIHYATFFSHGSLMCTFHEPVADNFIQLLVRFAKVFDQTYTRFLDLQKAEAQAREAQIELSLERIRAQVTAMQESSELLDIVVTMRREFVSLGHEAHYFWYMRYLSETYEKAMTSGDGTRIGMVMSLPRHIHGDIKLIADWEKSNEPTVVYAMDVDAALDYVQKMIKLGDFKQVDPNAPTLDDIRHIDGLTYVMARTTYGEIGFSLPGTVPDPPQESLDTLARFASVFDLAYRRFEDLKDAEQRNRETQIELALERVRAKTMAMHNSQDVGATVITLFEEVLNLGIDKSIRLGIGILAGYERMETWSANSNPKGETILKMGMLDMTIHPMLVGLKKAWKGGKKNYRYDYIGEDVFRYYEALNREPDYPFQADLNALPENEYHRSFFHPEGILFSFAPNPISEEAAMVLDRFAHVFGQTYRRYRDLQKAEEQAREAQIEAALERIRTQAMAMQHSDDLTNSTTILFEELEKLELPLERCGIGIFDKKTRDCQLYSTVVNEEGKTELATGITSLTVHPMLIKTFEAWEVQESLLYVLEGKELEDYYKLVSKSRFHLPEDVINKSASLVKEYYFYTPFGAGGLYVFSDIEPTSEEIKVIRRFAEVFHMTYTRYEDLQKAEARALEAVKQASLDRVRGEIAGMRTPEDLQHITPLIWSELEILEVPFIRCGVFIIDETKSNVQVHLTTPDGKPIGALNLPLDANELSHNTVEHWRKKKVYTIHWNKEDFISWMQSMISLGQIEIPEQYQGYTKPPESLDLHFIPFKQGMLYVGNTEPLIPEEIDLVKTLAEAFSIAYARYEDFVDLEEAKTHVEKTLSELKSAQSQLIHAEKMASLGELTAGIAHEIQNPLNFVNNFSEVSVDLIEEMNEEMESGDTDEVKAITNDLKQNLEKITYHGQRASGIVKGMLEHSRASKGHKELTNINELADEYLRLAYHGLRAKDKSFNASFNTDLDDSLPKISVVSQDIGRVLLNLINNAFHTVSTKALATVDSDYKPEVMIITIKLGDSIEIRVKDNGDGIPKDILDKIFQPFFTTKPSGEGTGLGLSLSYDIITKGHGGELKVNTKEKVGTEFIIVLPRK